MIAPEIAAMATQYMQYVAHHGKSYITSEEFAIRKALYIQTDAIIEMHNESNSTFTLGHNKFSDYTDAERSALTGAMKDDFRGEYVVLPESNADSVDWRKAGAVTPVKAQGQCGSCWSFSATGALEGAHFIANGELLSFSEQQLLDCVENDGCGPNGGGSKVKGMEYWESNNADLEADYAYTGKVGDCQHDSVQASDVAVSAVRAVTPNNVAQLKAAVA